MVDRTLGDHPEQTLASYFVTVVAGPYVSVSTSTQESGSASTPAPPRTRS